MALKTTVLFIVIISAIQGTLSLQLSGCFLSLGIANSSKIKDSQLIATSYLYSDKPGIYHFKPSYARLRTENGGGAWCSENANKGQYIQVDFLRNVKISYVQTQGRYKGAEFIQSYKLRYQRNLENEWRLVHDALSNEKVFSANNDTDTIVGNYLPHSIIARKVRLYPKGDLFSIHCVRMEMFGCTLKPDIIDVKSYSAPLGIKFGKYDLTDRAYDGEFNKRTNTLTHGLGALSDGFFGGRNLQNGWIGFNQSRIEITFEFAESKSFEELVIYTTSVVKGQQPFEHMEITASSNGLEYHLVENFTNAFTGFIGDKLKIRFDLVTARWMKCIVFQKPGNVIFISEITYVQGLEPQISTSKPKISTKVRMIPKTRAESTTREVFIIEKEVLTEALTTKTKRSRGLLSKKKKLAFTSATLDHASFVRTRGGSRRTKSFYIIVGVATFVAAAFTMLIVLFVWFLKKDKSEESDKKHHQKSHHEPDTSKADEPLLKLIRFQGVCGTSRFAWPECLQFDKSRGDREIPRAAVQFENKIGGGKFGEVFIGQIVCPMDGSLSLSRHSLIGQKIFIEVLKKGAPADAVSQLDEEIQALSCLQHPNMCRLVAVCTKSEPRFLLTECFEGMRLDSYLATLNASVNAQKYEILADIVVKLCSALKYLSTIKFIHRDIAARNVIYGIGNVIKLTNTAAACPGYSDCYYYIREKRCLYPIRWMAPEALNDSVATVQSDIWSFGVLLWEIYTFATAIPFDNQGNVEVLKQLQILNTIGCGCVEYLPMKYLGGPTLLLQIMRRCWHVNPAQRITADEIYETLTN